MSDVDVQTTISLFSMSCFGRVYVDAPTEKVWHLLTHVEQQRQWNTTLSSIDGDIREGGRVRLTTWASGERVFSPRVSEFVPNQSMVWSDGQAPFFKGVRTFAVEPSAMGTTVHMIETLSGILLPMIKRSLPDFAPIFATYLSDLKNAAE